MGFFSTLFLTGLGWALGGPVGAAIGFAISLLSSNSKPTIPRDFSADYEATTQKTTPADFRASLLVLIACVMKADGHIRRSELDVVKSFLLRNFGEEEAKEALQLLKNLLEQDIDVQQVATQISTHTNYSTRLEIIHLLLDVAYADGEIDASELREITRIATIFHLSAADFQSLCALYEKHKDPDWAYKALEIEASATDDEVKKAYRRMAMKYHPDKVAGAGEEVKQKANEKFQAINQAYETIKAQRGIK